MFKYAAGEEYTDEIVFLLESLKSTVGTNPGSQYNLFLQNGFYTLCLVDQNVTVNIYSNAIYMEIFLVYFSACQNNLAFEI
jgi:hypothetical protein